MGCRRRSSTSHAIHEFTGGAKPRYFLRRSSCEGSMRSSPSSPVDQPQVLIDLDNPGRQADGHHARERRGPGPEQALLDAVEDSSIAGRFRNLWVETGSRGRTIPVRSAQRAEGGHPAPTSPSNGWMEARSRYVRNGRPSVLLFWVPGGSSRNPAWKGDRGRTQAFRPGRGGVHRIGGTGEWHCAFGERFPFSGIISMKEVTDGVRGRPSGGDRADHR